jgi:stearoyl-CoA desaturase (delta-9 desaturase)
MLLNTIIIGLIWYQVIAHVGISAGLHRYWAHSAFKAGPIFEFISLYLAVLAGSRSPIGWIAAHRMHHSHSDTEDDPHSPLFKGFWVVFLSLWTVKHIPVKYSKDLFENPRILFFHKRWLIIWLATAIVTFLISPWLFFAMVVIPGVLAPIGFGTVNALCHMGGKSRNIPLANLLVAGEGYHSEHHSGKVLRFHKYDLTGAVLEFLLRRGFISI